VFPIEVWAQCLIGGLAMGGVYALLGSGLTLAYSITRVVHISHGDFLAIALYLCVVLQGKLGFDPYLSVCITAPVLFFLGLFIFRLVIKPLLFAEVVLAFQVFLGLVYIIENTLLIIFKADPRICNSFIILKKINLTSSLLIDMAQFIALIASLVIGIGFYFIIKRTDFGRAIRAIAEDPEAASLMGIRVEKIRMIVYGLAFMLIALAGSLVAPWWSAEPYRGLDFTLFTVMVMTIGGMGNFVGALLVGLLLGIARAFSGLLWGPTMAMTIPYAVLLIVLIVRPQGLLRGV
jgi:branched-chain amino acid transport system permease protein